MDEWWFVIVRIVVIWNFDWVLEFETHSISYQSNGIFAISDIENNVSKRAVFACFRHWHTNKHSMFQICKMFLPKTIIFFVSSPLLSYPVTLFRSNHEWKYHKTARIHAEKQKICLLLFFSLKLCVFGCVFIVVAVAVVFVMVFSCFFYCFLLFAFSCILGIGTLSSVQLFVFGQYFYQCCTTLYIVQNTTAIEFETVIGWPELFESLQSIGDR